VTKFRLETFGGLSLVGEEGPALLSQRRRLALLALLSVAGDRGMQRDKLLGYLWPESTPEGARHSLEQMVYGLRRELGQTLFIGSNPLLINPEMMSSDIADFESAIQRGDLADAIRQYRGPFLDGFYITDLSELEEWTSAERQRLSDAYSATLEKLAAEAKLKGDLDYAVELWRKRVAVDSLSARGALGLMRALADAGDRGGALQHAQVYERLVSQQLQAVPDREVKAFADELRRAPAPERHMPPLGSAPISPSNYSASAASAPSIQSQPIASRKRFRLGLGVAAGLVVATLLTASWVRSRPSGNPASTLDRNRVAVLPFKFAGSDSSLLYLGEGVMDLLAARLTGEGGPVAVDTRRTMSAYRRRSASGDSSVGEDLALAVARDVGAGEALSGELVATHEGTLSFSGSLIDATTGRSLARTTVTGRPDSLFALVDQLAARLLALRAGNDERNTAALTTTSLPALRAFLEGRAEARRDHPDAAIKAYSRALEFDSTFALAAVDLAHATGRLFQWRTVTTDTVARTRGIAFGSARTGGGDYQERWEYALRIGSREIARLSSRDRALLNAVRGNFPEPTDARTVLANWEAAVRAAPDRAEGYYSLGDVLLYQGRAMGLTDSPARAEAAFQRALALDPEYLQPLSGLIEIAAFKRDTSELRRLGRVFLSRDSANPRAPYVRWRVATVLGDVTPTAASRARFDSMAVSALDPIQWVSQVDGIGLADGDRAMRMILNRVSERQERQVAFHRAKFLALNRGRPQEALRIINAKRELEPNSDLKYNFAIRDALWWDGDQAIAREAISGYSEDLAAYDKNAGASAPESRRSRNWLFSLSLWRLAHNDTAGIENAIIRLRRSLRRGTGPTVGGVDIQAELLAGLHALHRKRTGDVVASLRLIDSAATSGCCSLPHFINFVSAQLHEGIGDRAGALAAVRRGRWLYPPEYLSTYLREEGRLAALTGDRAGAINAYRHYLTLRSDPEPSLRPQVAAIRAELTRLERMQ
jgi:DNA-binding SARP family transcriptional activator/TolB-like protein